MVENAATRRFLVLDASAWIHASESWLQRAALEKDLQLCTVPDVLHEVRDEAARKRLEWLLGLKSGGADDARALTVSEPSPKAVACVERAARETGDLGFLSAADVNLIALAIDLGHPEKPSEPVTSGNGVEETCGAGSAPSTRTASDSFDIHGERIAQSALSWRRESTRNPDFFDPRTYVFGEGLKKVRRRLSELDASLPESLLRGVDELSMYPGSRPHHRAERNRTACEKESQRSMKNDVQSCIPSEAEKDSSENGASSAYVDSSRGMSSHAEALCADTWLPPTHNPEAIASELRWDALKPGQVAIATTDFSMQNVMRCLDIPLVSVDSRKTIRWARHFIRLCTACNRTIDAQELDEQTIRFCPECGNYGTLIRCIKEVTADDSDTSGIGAKHRERIRLPRFARSIDGAPRLSTRGSLSSIPKPVGGRDGLYRDFILRADEYSEKLRRHQRMSRRKAANCPSNAAHSSAQGTEELFGPRQTYLAPVLPVVHPSSRNALPTGRHQRRSKR